MTSRTSLTRPWPPPQTAADNFSFRGCLTKQGSCYLTTGQGGTVVLEEECCFYVNESGPVEQNIQVLKSLWQDLQARYDLGTSIPWYADPLIAWLVLLLSPVLAGGAFILRTPVLSNF